MPVEILTEAISRCGQEHASKLAPAPPSGNNANAAPRGSAEQQGAGGTIIPVEISEGIIPVVIPVKSREQEGDDYGKQGKGKGSGSGNLSYYA